MANKNQKNSQNVDGKFYCTSSDDMSGQGCISCGVCYSMDSKHFASDDMGAAFVSNQPKTDEEISACKDVIEACPVQAIGDDGE